MQDIVVDPEEDTVGNTVDEEISSNEEIPANPEDSVEEELQETQEQVKQHI